MLRNVTQHYFFALEKTIYKNKKINRKQDEILKII